MNAETHNQNATSDLAVTGLQQPPQPACGIGPELAAAMGALLWFRRARARR